MNEPKIAAPLLTLLASGGTLQRCVSEMPAFEGQIDSAFEWMKSSAQRRSLDLGCLAERLREVVRTKDDAIRKKNFALAADMQAEQCALFESLGMSKPTSWTWRAIMEVGIDEQIQRLSALLCETQSSECEPNAAPNGGPAAPLSNSGVPEGPPSVS